MLRARNENSAGDGRLNLDRVNLATAKYSIHLTFEGLKEKFNLCQYVTFV